MNGYSLTERAAILCYIDRNGATFACGCRVRRQAYVTLAHTHAGKPTLRVRCLRHHRERCRDLMRLKRAA